MLRIINLMQFTKVISANTITESAQQTLFGSNTAKDAEIINTQFTPDQSNWYKMNEMTLAVSSVEDHSPDGVKWATNWPKWDGKVISVKGMTNSQVQSSLCTGGIIKGSRELYYEKPFRNAKAPTKGEVDDLHIRTINHLRKMVGIDQLAPISFDRCLCSIAYWSQILYSTSYWTKLYPTAKTDFCYSGGHCDFVPSILDQNLTFHGEKNSKICNSYMSATEGIGSTNADIPWSLKLHRTICQFLGEGTSGHAGPLFRREKLCPSFYYTGSGKLVTVRIKSGGKLYTNLPI